MAYRILCGLTGLLLAGSAAAAPGKIAVIVDGGGDRHDELGAAVAKALDAQLATTASRPADEVGLQALRASLEAARLVIVKADAQGHGRFTLSVEAIDESGVTHRFGDASTEGLLQAATRLVAELPPLPPPPPAAAPAVAADAPPPTGAVAAPAPPPEPQMRPVWRRHHPYQMLVAGVVSFFLPYFTTVGFAANYQSYDANAARVGYIPMAGPFLARQRINDKDLKDGYDPGLLVDGIVQTLTFNLLIAGIVYCAVGEKRMEYERVHPTISVGPSHASLGAAVTW
jgi:hypothetical protein